MKTRTIFKIAFISIFVFIIIGTYFWYLYFNTNEESFLSGEKGLKLINSGSIDYVNAIPLDDDYRIPIYYFRVKNYQNNAAKYAITLEDVSPSEANDGCSTGNLFKRSELKYILKLDNKIISKGLLSELDNNILDDNTVSGSSVNDYSLKIYLDENIQEYLNKHYHYRVNLVEKKWNPF